MEVGDEVSVNGGGEGEGGVGADDVFTFGPVDELIAFSSGGGQGDGSTDFVLLSTSNSTTDSRIGRGVDGDHGGFRSAIGDDVLIGTRIHLFGVVEDANETDHIIVIFGSDGEVEGAEAVESGVTRAILGEGSGFTSCIGVVVGVFFVEGHRLHLDQFGIVVGIVGDDVGSGDHGGFDGSAGDTLSRVGGGDHLDLLVVDAPFTRDTSADHITVIVSVGDDRGVVVVDQQGACLVLDVHITAVAIDKGYVAGDLGDFGHGGVRLRGVASLEGSDVSKGGNGREGVGCGDHFAGLAACNDGDGAHCGGFADYDRSSIFGGFRSRSSAVEGVVNHSTFGGAGDLNGNRRRGDGAGTRSNHRILGDHGAFAGRIAVIHSGFAGDTNSQRIQASRCFGVCSS